MSDREAISHLLMAMGGTKKAVLVHYVYFPEKDSAASAADFLKEKGFEVESRLGADMVNWLVLAKNCVAPSEEVVGQARKMFEDLADRLDGEYDGWEGEVR